MITIKRFENQHIRSISEIYVDNWKDTYRNLLDAAFLDEMNYADQEDKFQKYLYSEGHGAFVAIDENEKVLGFALYKPYLELDNCLLLDSLHIAEEARAKGIGKALIARVGEYAVDEGCSQMSICYIRGNDRAKNIYGYLGAKHYKDFTDYFEGTPSNSTVLVWDDLSIFKTMSKTEGL